MPTADANRLDGRTYDEYPQRIVSAIPERESCLVFAHDIVDSFRKTAAGQHW
jgi:hypothetical protein